MNENQALAQEMMIKALLSKQNENSDILSILSLMMGDLEAGIKQANEGIAAVKNDTEQIGAKLDTVLEKLEGLEAAFSDLKNENRELEQKLTLMVSKLERVEKSISDDVELEDYYGLCQSIYNNWEDLDPLTRRLIPVAEYLFSKLQKYDKPDYSPVILELCRAIENEFLLKIFRKYTLDLISREGRNLLSFLAMDKANSQLTRKTGEFVRAITKASKTKSPEYTLGQMNTIMSLLTDRTVVQMSPLLQDFSNYLKTNTVVKDLLNIQYIQSINAIVRDYRNPSAHPGFMTFESAQKCKSIMPDKIDYLMDCLAAE